MDAIVSMRGHILALGLLTLTLATSHHSSAQGASLKDPIIGIKDFINSTSAHLKGTGCICTSCWLAVVAAVRCGVM